MALIKKFKEITRLDTAIAGGKGASLGEMTRAKIPVPHGFVILSSAFEKFLEETDLNVKIEAVLDSVNHKKIHTIENASEKIDALILQAEMPQDIATEIQKFFKNLNSKYVAVRSSATAEDSASAAWAGQLESYLNTTKENLLENVKKCWASLFTPRAIFYRFEKDLHKQKISVAVVVQKMVESKKSGIAFSVHPVTQDRNQLIIEAGFGLGEAIVSGQITPDSYVVEKRPRRIIDKNVQIQAKGLYRAENGGNEWRDIFKKQGGKQVLSDGEILELSEIILKIENHYNFPCDIEWAFENGKFYIVQSRPITTLRNNASQSSTEEFIVPRMRESMLTPVYWNAVLQTSQVVKKNYGKTLNVEYNFFFGGHMNTVIPKQEWDEVGEYIAERLVKDKGYFENIEEKTDSAKQEIEFFLKSIKEKDLSKLSFQNLVGLAEEIYSLFMKYDSASVFAWFVAGDILKEKIGVRLDIYGDDLDIIALPNEQTSASRMERDVLEVSLKEDPIEKMGKFLSEKYYWIPFGYDGPNAWDSKHFAQRIEEYRKNTDKTKRKLKEMIKREKDLKQKAKRVLADNKIDRDGHRLVHILQSTAVWTDERKMLEFQIFFWYSNILAELGRRYDLSVVQLKYLFTNELKRLEKDALKFKKIAEQRISKEFMTISNDGDIRIAEGAEKQKIKKIIERQSQKGDIRGNVACRGTETKYIASVKILRSSKECAKVQQGEILVATMTTPDYVPAMDRALGFITDEGGVTCHAAIVAREMNKPCIIGTKNATQILKDGNRVEMDVTTGAVKILK